MKYLNDFFNEKSIEFTKKYVFKNDIDGYKNEIRNDALKSLETGDLRPMLLLGEEMSRNEDGLAKICGLGWLLKLIDMYDNNETYYENQKFKYDFHNPKYSYYEAKYWVARMFLPESIPYFNENPIDSIRFHVKDTIFEDNGYGIKLLKECSVEDNPLCKTPCMLLSIMYYSGCVVERDYNLALEYFNKYLKHIDNDEIEHNSKFIDWFKTALSEMNKPIF